MLRERYVGIHSSKCDVSIKFLFSKFRESWGREDRQSVRARGSGGHQVNKHLKINWAKLIWTHIDWSSMHRACIDWYQVLCIYIITFSLFFWRGLYFWMSGCMILMPSLGALFLLLVCLVQFWCDSFILSYHIVFCCVLLLSLRNPFFSNENQKGSGSECGGRWSRTKRSRGKGLWWGCVV